VNFKLFMNCLLHLQSSWSCYSCVTKRYCVLFETLLPLLIPRRVTQQLEITFLSNSLQTSERFQGSQASPTCPSESDKGDYGGLGECYWLGKTKVLGKKSNPVQMCPSYVWHGPSWNRIRNSELRNRQLKLYIYLLSISHKNCLYPSENPV